LDENRRRLVGARPSVAQAFRPANAPAPAPPAPAPGPAKTIQHAKVSTSHWYPGAAFTLPDTFDLVIEGDMVKIATLDPLPFTLYKSNEDFFVKQRDFEFIVQGGSFAFSGVAGQASGTITVANDSQPPVN